MSAGKIMRTDSAQGNGAAASASSLVHSLELAAVFLIALTLALAPLGPGHPASDPETALSNFLVWLAATLWLTSRMLAGSVTLPPLRLALGLGLFAGFTALAVSRAAWEPYAGQDFGLGIQPRSDGDGQAALDLAAAWLAHLLLFLCLWDLGRDPRKQRLFLSCLFAGAAAVALYSLYQRQWGLPYFRHFFQENPEAVQRTIAADPATHRALALRIASDRVYGPFGYPNALAGYLLLFLPAWFGLWRQGLYRKKILMFAAVICAIGLVFSGSKAGLLAAKAIEVATLVWLMPRRSPAYIADAVAGVAGATLVSTVCALAIWAGCAHIHAGAWNRTLAEIAFALLWAGECWWLAERAARGASLNLPARITGMAVAIAAAVFAGWSLTAEPLAGDSSAAQALKRLQSEIKLMVGVRSQYWLAAYRMIADHPLRGVGLDNFGCRYTAYKNAEGWPVRRAHNHYLQLAADGGLPLLAAFLAVLVILYRIRLPQMPALAPDRHLDNQHRFLGVAAGLAAFSAIYYLFSRGIFLGLSLEFCVREMRPGTGDWLAALGHGVLHLILLPLTWALVFSGVWQALAQSDIRPWLRWGIMAMLLHAVADFHLSFASLGMIFWAAAALACAGKGSALTLGGCRRFIALAIILIMLCGFGAIAAPAMQGAVALRLAENSREIIDAAPVSEQADHLNAAIRQHEIALQARPRDAELRRHYADLLLRRIHRAVEASFPPGISAAEAGRRAAAILREMPPTEKEQVLAAWREVVARTPYFADAYAQTSRRLFFLFPADEFAKEQARRWLEAAIALAPTRALYRLEMARLCRAAGDAKAASEAAAMALALDSRMTDTQARLAPAEVAEAESLRRDWREPPAELR